MDRPHKFECVRAEKTFPNYLYYPEACGHGQVTPSVPPGLTIVRTLAETTGADRSRSTLHRDPLDMHRGAQLPLEAWYVINIKPPSAVSSRSQMHDYASRAMDIVAAVVAIASLICLTVMVVAATQNSLQFYDTEAPVVKAEVGLLFQDGARLHPPSLVKQPEVDGGRQLKASTGTKRSTPSTVESSPDVEVAGSDNLRLGDGNISPDTENDREWTIDAPVDTTEETSTPWPYIEDEVASTVRSGGLGYPRIADERRLPFRKTLQRTRSSRRQEGSRKAQPAYAHRQTVSTTSDCSGDDFQVLVPEEARR